MELFIFARFHAGEGQEAATAAVLRTQIARVRTEPGCLAIEVFGAVRDPRLFYIHSRWSDAAAFEAHAERPGTTEFLERMERLCDQRREVTRAVPLG